MHQEAGMTVSTPPSTTTFDSSSASFIHHRHQTCSTDSLSPTTHSNSSFTTQDDPFDISSPVNESDEIILLPHHYYDDLMDCEAQLGSLWHDLEKDGIESPAIPSFILHSPSIGPIGGEFEMQKGNTKQNVPVSHSLRKGCDPKYFFGELKENISTRDTFVPSVDIPSSQHTDVSKGFIPPAIAKALWPSPPTENYSPPSQGWGHIPSRAIEISNLPKSTQLWTLVELLKGLGDRTGIFTETIAIYGTAIVGFHDLRDALRCLRHVRGEHFFGNRRLDSRFVSEATLIDMASQGYKIPFLGVTSGKVFVAGEREIEVGLMRDMLESFGEIYSFETNEREGGKVVVCEYFDRRRATDVIESMNGRDIFGTRLSLWEESHPILGDSHLRVPIARTFPPFTSLPPTPMSSSFPSAEKSHWNGKSSFPDLSPQAFSEPESSKSVLDTNDNFHLPYRRVQLPSERIGYGFDAYDAYPPLSTRATRKWTDDDLEQYFNHLRISPRRVSPPTVKEERRQPGLLRPMPIRGANGALKLSETTTCLNASDQSDDSVSDESIGATSGRLPHPGMGVTSGLVPLRNRVDLERIRKGLDTRTTIMVKNVPNKYTQQMLMEYVDITNAGTYDFLYLRIDFQNKCNVGYAFINFIDPQSIIPFAKARVGTKWNRFHSDKICDISYANIQGKECLIEKFRNSCVMDEDPSYRPKIFHSSGSLMGQEQEFPEPNNARRKLRSIACARQIGLYPPVALRKAVADL